MAFKYLTVPSAYEEVYNTLLIELSNYGENLLKDCKADCRNDNRKLIKNWNIFQAACAAYAAKDTRKANLMINYIIGDLQLDIEEFDLDFTIEDESFFSLSKTFLAISSAGTADIPFEIPFTCTDDIQVIEATSNKDWCYIETWNKMIEDTKEEEEETEDDMPSTGELIEAPKAFKLIVEDNPNITSRMATITLKSDSEFEATIKIIQEANENNNWN